MQLEILVDAVQPCYKEIIERAFCTSCGVAAIKPRRDELEIDVVIVQIHFESRRAFVV
jgi:hypothetical protein